MKNRLGCRFPEVSGWGLLWSFVHLVNFFSFVFSIVTLVQPNWYVITDFYMPQNGVDPSYVPGARTNCGTQSGNSSSELPDWNMITFTYNGTVTATYFGNFGWTAWVSSILMWLCFALRVSLTYIIHPLIWMFTPSQYTKRKWLFGSGMFVALCSTALGTGGIGNLYAKGSNSLAQGTAGLAPEYPNGFPVSNGWANGSAWFLFCAWPALSLVAHFTWWMMDIRNQKHRMTHDTRTSVPMD